MPDLPTLPTLGNYRKSKNVFLLAQNYDSCQKVNLTKS